MKEHNISDKVFNYIQDKIINKTWQPGDRITSEVQLADELQVSRISVRDAISRLVAMNILTKKKGGGSYVNSFTPIDYMDELLPLLMTGDLDYIDILEFRLSVETLSVKLFIERATKDEFSSLRACFETMSNYVTDKEKFFEQDVNFHKNIASGSHNPIIEKILSMIFKIMEGKPKKQYHQLSAEERIEEHRKILDAIESKDIELAMIYSSRHLQRTINDLKNL